MKILVVGDIHAASHNISVRKDDYFKTCKSKLTFVLRKAVEQAVSAIVFTGDVFHDKEERLISTKLVHTFYNFMDYCSQYSIKVICVPGNHDMQFHNPDMSDRNLGLIARAYKGTFYLVNQTPLVVKSDISCLFTGSSFIFRGDEGDLHERSQYFPTVTVEEPFDYHIHVTHGNLIPFSIKSDFEFMPITCTQDLLAAKPVFDMNINGHIHWPGEDGRVIQIGNKYSLNPGSLTRGSLKMENIKRKISIYLVELTDANGEVFPTFTEIEVPCRPAEEIFDVNEYLAEKRKYKEIEMFIEMLKETSLSEESSNANIERLIEESAADEETKACAREYIERIS